MTSHSLNSFIQLFRPFIENELQTIIDEYTPAEKELKDMLYYHLGWKGEGAGPEAQGKRIRPLLVLLCCQAAGGDWQKALPWAAAVELIHNFSLVHDDIQDNSPTRRGRPTVWVNWGVAQAINCGDLLFTLAHQAILRAGRTMNPQQLLDALGTLDQACIDLTYGQHLDLAYETRKEVKIANYWPMINGKTASLLACCCCLGSIAAGNKTEQRLAFHQFGVNLGLAFQVVDDWLGIWGDSALTGKSTESDLETGKKTLPVLYALEKDTNFQALWNQKLSTPAEIEQARLLLVENGAQDYIQQEAESLTQKALKFLQQGGTDVESTNALIELAQALTDRKK